MRNFSYHLCDFQYTSKTPGLTCRRTRSDPHNDVMSPETCVIIVDIWNTMLRIVLRLRFFPLTNFLPQWLLFSSFHPPPWMPASCLERDMTSAKPFPHPFTIVMPAGQSIIFDVITSSRFPLTFFLVLSLQLSFASPHFACHICPPIRPLMEYTSNAGFISPNLIRLPRLLSSGYIDRCFRIFDGRMVLGFGIWLKFTHIFYSFLVLSFSLLHFLYSCLPIWRILRSRSSFTWEGQEHEDNVDWSY